MPLYEHFNTSQQTEPRFERHENFVTDVKLPSCALVQTLPYEQRCDYLRRTGFCNNITTLLNYIDIFYCNLKIDNETTLTMGLVALIIICVYLFLMLGICVDSFFCPSLKVLADILHMNENVAGVTLLAFANGAPDIFTGFAGILSESRTLYSDVFASVAYVVFFVGGLIVTMVPFTIQGSNFIRDICFLILDVTFIDLVIKKKGGVNLLSSCLILGIYIFYLFVVIVDQYLLLRNTRLTVIDTRGSTLTYVNLKRRERSEMDGPKPKVTLFSAACVILGKINFLSSLYPREHIQHRSNTNIHQRSKSNLSKSLSGSKHQLAKKKSNGKKVVRVVSDIDIEKDSSSKKGETTDDQTESTETLDIPEKKKPIKSALKVKIATAPQLLDSDMGIFSPPAAGSPPPEPMPTGSIDSSYKRISTISTYSTFSKYSNLGSFDDLPDINLFRQFIETINPIDMKNWRQNNLFFRFTQILSIPIRFFLLFLIPIVDYEEFNQGWSKLLNCIQLVILPAFLYMVLFGSTVYWKLPMYVWVGIFILPSAIFLFFTTKTNEAPPKFKYFSIIGGCGSILILYISAKEIISILDSIGIITYRSNSFLGCTLLAWGNCVGDLVANVAVARQGFQRMGFAACTGGSLFHSLLLIGAIYLHKCLKSEDHIFYTGEGILGDNATVMLVSGLFCTLFAVITTNFVLRRSIGVFMIIIYLLYLFYAILAEWSIIHPYGSDHRLDIRMDVGDS